MTTILLIRHGATAFSKENRFAGSVDVELSEEGRLQAGKLSQRLASETIAAVYCSDMRRAIDTAEAISAPHNRSPIVRPALREIDHGLWEQMLHEDVVGNHADQYEAWEHDPLLIAPPGGETGLGVLARSLPELARIVADHPHQTVAVVSHKATNRLLLCSILGIDPRLYRKRLSQDTACLNIVEFRGITHGMVTLLNDVSHYFAPNPLRR